MGVGTAGVAVKARAGRLLAGAGRCVRGGGGWCAGGGGGEWGGRGRESVLELRGGRNILLLPFTQEGGEMEGGMERCSVEGWRDGEMQYRRVERWGDPTGTAGQCRGMLLELAV